LALSCTKLEVSLLSDEFAYMSAPVCLYT
jgi:hypothetical protein